MLFFNLIKINKIKQMFKHLEYIINTKSKKK